LKDLEPIYYSELPSPLGMLVLVATPRGLSHVSLNADAARARLSIGATRNDTAVSEARRQLEEYFSGKRRQFDLTLDLHGSDFQLQVWRRLAEIAWGEVMTYGEMARSLGQVSASRAVGIANGLNPIPIIIPCHRVIAAGGMIGGFSGGLQRKEWLLRHEGWTVDGEHVSHEPFLPLFAV
jgi:methylated-DNA-[protein]-cysteine S-methyltransferase